MIATITLAAWVGRSVYVFLAKSGVAVIGDEIYYSAQAEVIAAGGWYRHPFQTSPDGRLIEAADHVPLTSLVLAPFSWMDRPIMAQRYTMAAIGACTVLLIAILARRLFGDRVAVIAALISGSYAGLWINDALVMSETVSALAVTVLLITASNLIARPSFVNAALVGAALGLAALARAELLVLSILMVTPILLWSRLTPDLAVRRRLELLAVSAATCLAVLTPWTVYNMTRFVEPVTLSTQAGAAVAGAYCGRSFEGGGTGLWSLACIYEITVDPATDQSQQSAVYMESGLDYAREHIDDLPLVAATRFLRGFSISRPSAMVWYNQGEGREAWASWIQFWQYWALTPLAIAGAWIARRRPELIALLAPVVLTVLVTVLLYASTRFRITMEPTTVVLAALALDRLVWWANSRWWPKPEPIHGHVVAGSPLLSAGNEIDGVSRDLKPSESTWPAWAAQDGAVSAGEAEHVAEPGKKNSPSRNARHDSNRPDADDLAGVEADSHRIWLPFVAVVSVIVAVAAFAYVMTNSGDGRERENTGAFEDEFTDTFDRPASQDGLGAAPGVGWTDVRGQWGVQGGVAFLPSPDPTLNVTVDDIDTRDVQIAAVVGGDGVCGVTARYLDEDNYLALIRVPGFAVWNVVEVVDGVERVIFKVPDTANPNVAVVLEVGDDIVTAVSDFSRVSVVASPASGGTRVGLIARGGDMDTCTWDDVVVRRAT